MKARSWKALKAGLRRLHFIVQELGSPRGFLSEVRDLRIHAKDRESLIRKMGMKRKQQRRMRM